MKSEFSLALGGGAARGLAHIWVIQRLEELGKTPREISGTSIGAVIGAFYAAGYTSTEMRQIALETKILKLVDLDLKNGLLKGNKIMKYFSKLLWDITFKDLKIPLSIIATDIDTGEKVIFRDGKLIDAIRASISIPGIFVPFKYQRMHLVDGWIVENLPISSLSHDFPVIAISVQLDVTNRIRKKKSLLFPNGTMFGNSYLILRKMVSIMMFQNELRSLELYSWTHLIRPMREDIDFYDFWKMSPMIEEWYRVSESLVSYFSH